MLCLFFCSIGVTSAGDFSNDNNINFNNESNINTGSNEISYELSNENALNMVKSTNVSDNFSGIINANNSVNANFVSSSSNVTNINSVNADLVSSSSNTKNNTTVKATTTNSTKTINSTKTTNITKTTSIVSKTTKSNKVLAAGDGKPTKLSQKQISVASNSVYKYVLKNKVLPNFVTIAGYKFSMPEFMYLISKTIANKYKKNNSDIIIKYDVNNPSKPSGTNVKVKMSSKYYYKYANNVAKFIEKNNQAPNYVTTSWGKIQYQSIISEFSKLLRLAYLNKSKLPKDISIKVSKSQKINKIIPKYPDVVSLQKPLSSDDSKAKASSGILNTKYNNESLIEFLSSSKNCQATSNLIKSLAKNITKNSKTELEKATAIFNWVRDKVSYTFYYNTKKGAEKTLSSKSGNCVDQTHLLIALMRSSGISAKYVNGKATFNSGNTYGHVWAQILIGDVWFVADTTSSKNSIGVINNWNVKTAKIYGTYSSIGF